MKRNIRYGEYTGSAIWKPFYKFFSFLKAVISDFFYDISVKLNKVFHKKQKVTNIKTKRRNQKIFYTCLLIYPVAQFLIFYVFVNINSILLAFQTYDVDTATFYYTGFNNFIDVVYDLFNDVEMKTATINSFKIYFFSLVIGLPLNLIFSFLMYKKIPAHGIFRVVLFLPQIISSLVISLMFRYFVEEAMPELLDGMNLLLNKKTGFGTMIFYGIWASFGTQILIYTNAFSKISPELVEYGKLEGMNLWQEFIHVSLPAIFPTITIFLVAGVAGIFVNQASLFNFYGTGAKTHLKTLGYIFFVQVLKSESAAYALYPYASAAGLIFTLVATPITLLLKWALEKFGPRED